MRSCGPTRSEAPIGRGPLASRGPVCVVTPEVLPSEDPLEVARLRARVDKLQATSRVADSQRLVNSTRAVS